jgi:cell division topological specificity factor
MFEWLERMFGQKQPSADQAKQRLKLVLIHDRIDFTPGQMEKMKNELLQVISKYIEIDPESVNITMMHEGREQRLVADIALKAPARSRGR